MWKQSLQAEAARGRGLEAAACLIDLVKAFEMVKLELVWRMGLELHFPPVLLRLILEACAFARHLVFQGAVAEAVWSLSAILAGGSFATDLLFIIMVGPCDRIASTITTGDLCLFVDDLTLHVWGTSSTVAQHLEEAVSYAIALLEEELELQVSRGTTQSKTVTTASSGQVAARLRPRMAALGVRECRHAKLLGIDFSCGSRLKRSAQSKRIAAVTARKGRLSALGKRAARRISQTGAAPAMRYGAGVTGASSAAVRKVRRFECGVQGEMRGRSTCLWIHSSHGPRLCGRAWPGELTWRRLGGALLSKLA